MAMYAPNQTTLPGILRSREHGLLCNFQFSDRIFCRQKDWKISTNHTIPSTDLTALDLSPDARFLVAGSAVGTCMIYDFTETRNSIKHEPIQQATVPTPSRMTAVQWYPVDTGIFLTATAGGTVSLWDTEAMEPVLNVQPFQYTETSSSYALRCMQVCNFSSLAAAGSNGSATVKLIDLRSGASSHSLTPPGVAQGVSAVRWSPVNENVVATCSRSVLLWDIRRPNRILTCLNAEEHFEPLVSKPIWTDGSHFARPRSDGPTTRGTNCMFDERAQRLVTVDGQSRKLQCWDLRYSSPQKLQSFVDSENGKPVDSDRVNQPLLVSNSAIWVARGNEWVEYGFSHDRPVRRLQGHLGRVQAATKASNLMITSAADGLTLIWEQTHEKDSQLHPDTDDW